MADAVDELGPVDWYVIELAGSGFDTRIVSALHSLADSGVIRLLDVVVVRTHPDGSVEALELADLTAAEAQGATSFERELAGLLSTQDVAAIAQHVGPGTTATCLVWENLAITTLTHAVRSCGARPVANGRVSSASLLAVLEDHPYESVDSDAWT